MKFKPGQSGNPRGRPKKDKGKFAQLIDGVFDADVEYVEDGHKKMLSRKELAVKQHIQKGISGKLANIAALLDLRDEAKKSGRAKPKIIIENWIPDRPEQTGAQKARETAAARAQNAGATGGVNSIENDEPKEPSS
jgi:hypothetical protein